MTPVIASDPCLFDLALLFNKAAFESNDTASSLHTSTTTDYFVSNIPDLSKFLSMSNRAEKRDDVTETMDSLFPSTLDMVAPLRLRKIKEKNPTLWYNGKWSAAG